MYGMVCYGMYGVDSKVDRKFISHLTRAQHTLPAVESVHVPLKTPTVRFSFLLRGCGASFQDGIAAEEGFLCAPF
jgi:hypothetical protein